MSERIIDWGIVAAGGLLLGFLVVSQWAPYDLHTPMVVPGWVLTLGSLIMGAILAFLFEQATTSLASVMVLIVVTVSVPVTASVVTSHLLGTTELLDVIIYSSIQRAIGQSVMLFVMLIAGLGLGMLARGYIFQKL